jgi:hypothetical protein
MYTNNKDGTLRYGRQMDIVNTFRELWEEHIMWTRSFIISTVSDLGDLDLVTQRLLGNPEDFADVLRRFYGYDNSRKFEALFKNHLLLAAKLLNDAKAGDTQSVDADRAMWYKNADEIADFLAGANSYWDKKEWQNLLYDHLKMTEDEAVYRLNMQYKEDIANYDSIESQALNMADYMASGIINQFKL